MKVSLNVSNHTPTGTSFIPQERPQQSLLGAIRVSLKLQVGPERHVYSKLEQKPPDKKVIFSWIFNLAQRFEKWIISYW